MIKGEVGKSLGTVLDFLVKGKGTLGRVITTAISKLTKVANLMPQQVSKFPSFLVDGLIRYCN